MVCPGGLFIWSNQCLNLLALESQERLPPTKPLGVPLALPPVEIEWPQREALAAALAQHPGGDGPVRRRFEHGLAAGEGHARGGKIAGMLQHAITAIRCHDTQRGIRTVNLVQMRKTH